MSDLFALVQKLGMRLSREALDALLTHAQRSHLSPAQLVEELATLEQREREARNLVRRQKIATLGSPVPLDQFDWNHARSIDRGLYEELLTLPLCQRSCPLDRSFIDGRSLSVVNSFLGQPG